MFQHAANERAADSACHRGCGAAASAADLVAQRAADDAAGHGAYSAITAAAATADEVHARHAAILGVGLLLVARLLVLAVARLRIGLLRVVAVVGVALAGREGERGSQAQRQGSGFFDVHVNSPGEKTK